MIVTKPLLRRGLSFCATLAGATLRQSDRQHVLVIQQEQEHERHESGFAFRHRRRV